MKTQRTRLLLFGITILFVSMACSNIQTVPQSARKIPVIDTVDVLIYGGTTSAVSAAVSASKNGAKTLLLTSKPYLGEDICATLRLEINAERALKNEIEKGIFGYEDPGLKVGIAPEIQKVIWENKTEQGEAKISSTPLKVKAKLIQILLNSDNVRFLFGTYPTDILWADKVTPCGMVVANRAGRQAIYAKTIIDATDNAWVCRMAGAKSEQWKGMNIDFERTVLLEGSGKNTPKFVSKSISIPMSDLCFSSFENAEQIARDSSYTENQLRASEDLFYIPPHPIECKKKAEAWNGSLDIKHFEVQGFNNLYVLSGSADIPREIAKELLQPAAMSEVGTLIGKAMARKSTEIVHTQAPYFKIKHKQPKLSGDIKEELFGLSSVELEQHAEIYCPETGIPILANYDIVVVGGGTSGAPAAISACRKGKKVLVIEYMEGLGGIGTLGLIGKPYHGINRGFASEVPFPEDGIESKMEWYRNEIRKAGGDIWLGAIGCGAFVDENKVKGVVVSTVEGRGVVRAKAVIDATGNADIAISAGAKYMYGDIENGRIAIQGTGFSSRPLHGTYFNSDYLLVDENNMTDIWRALVSVQITKFSENQYDVIPTVQNRERRRIVGEHILDYLDQVAGRTFEDAIVLSKSDYDSHGYPSLPYFAMLPHDDVSMKENHPAPGGICYTPYRSLIPENMNGILVTGLAISMHRDASAMIRMQFDIANQGYAAGLAAVLAIDSKSELRDIDIKELQKQLIEKGNLPEEVLDLKDSYPLSAETIEKAVVDFGKSTNPNSAGKSLAIILTHQDTSIPLMKAEYEKVEGESELLYAQVLAMCGINDGVPLIISNLEKVKEWDNKIFQGSMADYAHLPTPIDALVISLGYSKDKRAIPEIIRMLDKLDKDITLSHHRSVALALEEFSDPQAAKPLAMLLMKEDMRGHAMLNIEDALKGTQNNGLKEREKRTKALREIVLARALYKCGDYNGMGEEILLSYTNDLQGLFVRHANQVLKKYN